jgi:hypothetical protein
MQRKAKGWRSEDRRYNGACKFNSDGEVKNARLKRKSRRPLQIQKQFQTQKQLQRTGGTPALRSQLQRTLKNSEQLQCPQIMDVQDAF